MIVAVDASALVALALGEPEREEVEACLRDADDAFATPLNITEAGLTLILRDGRFTPQQYERWLSDLRVTEMGIDAAAALRVYLQYGKGVHRARLNLGDCFAYALAKTLDAPLLYKGDDFALTDIRSALQPT